MPVPGLLSTRMSNIAQKKTSCGEEMGCGEVRPTAHHEARSKIGRFGAIPLTHRQLRISKVQARFWEKHHFVSYYNFFFFKLKFVDIDRVSDRPCKFSVDEMGK